MHRFDIVLQDVQNKIWHLFVESKHFVCCHTLLFDREFKLVIIILSIFRYSYHTSQCRAYCSEMEQYERHRSQIDTRLDQALWNWWYEDIVIKFVWGDERQGFLPDRQRFFPQDPKTGEIVTIITRPSSVKIDDTSEDAYYTIICYQFDTDRYTLVDRSFQITSPKETLLNYLNSMGRINYVEFVAPTDSTSKSIPLTVGSAAKKRRYVLSLLPYILENKIGRVIEGDKIGKMLGEETVVAVKIYWRGTRVTVDLNWEPFILDKEKSSIGKFTLGNRTFVDRQKGIVSFDFHFTQKSGLTGIQQVTQHTFVDVQLDEFFDYIYSFPQNDDVQMKGTIRKL